MDSILNHLFSWHWKVTDVDFRFNYELLKGYIACAVSQDRLLPLCDHRVFWMTGTVELLCFALHGMVHVSMEC